MTKLLELPEDLKERAERRQAFLEAGRNSREEFQRTGIAYRHEDVMRYMREKLADGKPRKTKPVRIPKSER